MRWRPSGARFGGPVALATTLAAIVFAALAVIVLVPPPDRPETQTSPAPRARGSEASPVTVRLRFLEATANGGLPVAPTTTWGAAVGPGDDAGPALLLNRHTRPPELLMAEDGAFQPVDVSWSDSMDRHLCTWGEANGDARPDLLCVQGARGGDGSGPNELWLNLPEGFVESAVAAGLDYPDARGRVGVWLDYDRDGDLDVFLGGVRRTGWPDQLFRNDGGRFAPVRSDLGGERMTIGAAVGDLTNDGWPDVLLVQAGSPPELYRNARGRFEAAPLGGIPADPWDSATLSDYDGDGWLDVHLVSRHRSALARNVGGAFTIADERVMGRARSSALIDVDNDGRLDIYVVRSASGPDTSAARNAPDIWLLQRDDGSFESRPVSASRSWAGSGDAVVTLDYDRDGRTDVLVTNGRARWEGPTVLLRNASSRGTSATIRLVGSPRNPFGLGARVRVELPRRSYDVQVTDRTGGAGQSEVGTLVLGLGGATRARVTVRWPDGTIDCNRVAAGAFDRFVRGETGCSAGP